MLREIDIRLPLRESGEEVARRREAARLLRVVPRRIGGMRVLKESIDARQRRICKQLHCLVAVDEPLPAPEPLPEPPHKLSGGAVRVIIVGCGPAGLFAALRCLELGVCPVVLERGKDVTARRFDLKPINCLGRVERVLFLMASSTRGLRNAVLCQKSTASSWHTALPPPSSRMPTPISDPTNCRASFAP